MKAVSSQVSSKLLCLPQKSMQNMQGKIPTMFHCWADLVLLKSSLVCFPGTIPPFFIGCIILSIFISPVFTSLGVFVYLIIFYLTPVLANLIPFLTLCAKLCVIIPRLSLS